MDFMNIAHRGFSSRYPENTLVAFQAAFDLGCEWVECDIRRTTDGRYAVIHDATVDRTTDGRGRIDELSWVQVRALDAGGWKGPEFAGERIPSLEELLDLAGETGPAPRQIVIELKMPSDYVGEVVEIVRRHDAFDRTVASAFEWDTILALRRKAPDWRTTWLDGADDCSLMAGVARCAVAGVTTYGPKAAVVSPELAAAAHDAGLLLRCWGLGDDEGPLLEKVVDTGADGATTNYPDALMAILKR
jgi:glycerophosphoryl diester phosphodiesterase